MSDENTNLKDRRMSATSTIMGTSVGMLALCIPLCALTGLGILPLFVIGGAALATVAVWAFGASKETGGVQQDRIAELEGTVLDLRERLESLETMSRYEATLAGGTLLEPTKSPPKTMARELPEESD